MANESMRNYMIFKEQLITAASALRVNFYDFANQCDLNSFLLDAQEWEEPVELVAEAMESLIGEVKNNNYVICTAVVFFLDKALGAPKSDDNLQRLKDLSRIAQSAKRRKATIEWCRSHYS